MFSEGDRKIFTLVCSHLTTGNVLPFGIKLLKNMEKAEYLVGRMTPCDKLQDALINLTMKWFNKYTDKPTWRMFVDKLRTVEVYNSIQGRLVKTLDKLHIGISLYARVLIVWKLVLKSFQQFIVYFIFPTSVIECLVFN